MVDELTHESFQTGKHIKKSYNYIQHALTVEAVMKWYAEELALEQ